MAQNEQHLMDGIAKKLLCSKSKFRAHFSILEIDGRSFIVEHAFMDFLAQKHTELKKEPSRIIVPAGVSL